MPHTGPLVFQAGATHDVPIAHVHGIKTTMQVEVVAPNHLRMVDKLEPPDQNNMDNGGGPLQDMESTPVIQERDMEKDMEEIICQTPHGSAI